MVMYVYRNRLGFCSKNPKLCFSKDESSPKVHQNVIIAPIGGQTWDYALKPMTTELQVLLSFHNESLVQHSLMLIQAHTLSATLFVAPAWACLLLLFCSTTCFSSYVGTILLRLNNCGFQGSIHRKTAWHILWRHKGIDWPTTPSNSFGCHLFHTQEGRTTLNSISALHICCM
jgi:hypothetical protein